MSAIPPSPSQRRGSSDSSSVASALFLPEHPPASPSSTLPLPGGRDDQSTMSSRLYLRVPLVPYPASGPGPCPSLHYPTIPPPSRAADDSEVSLLASHPPVLSLPGLCRFSCLQRKDRPWQGLSRVLGQDPRPLTWWPAACHADSLPPAWFCPFQPSPASFFGVWQGGRKSPHVHRLLLVKACWPSRSLWGRRDSPVHQSGAR